MTSASAIDTAAGRRPGPTLALPATPRFEWTVVGLSFAIGVAAHLDTWAHGHLASALETFLTPWHALLYASVAATTGFLVISAALTRSRGAEWRRALPDGYGLSLVGCGTFVVGGVLDGAWHVAFGLERNFQALVSPTHVVLIAGAGLVASGPLRAAWRRPGRAIGWTGIASATLTLSAVTYFAQFVHPFTSQWAALPLPQAGVPAEQAQQLGILGIVVHSGLLMGVVLLLVRRFALPFGSLTLLAGVTAAFVTMVKSADPIMLVGVLGGLAADALYVLLRPSPARLPRFRLFAFMVPLLLYSFYFTYLIGATGVWWPVHLWAGAPLVAGLTGLLVSIVAVPPPAPTPELVR